MRVFGPELNESLLAAVARGVTLSTPREASVLEFFAGAVAASGRMCSLEGGLDVLPRALADRLDVRLGARVTGVQRDGAGVRVHLGSGQVEHADACVLTTSFVEAVELYPALSTTSCAARHGCTTKPLAWVMLAGGGGMADTKKTAAMLLDALAALDPLQRREVAAILRTGAETFAGVPDGEHTAHALRMLAHMLDSG